MNDLLKSRESTSDARMNGETRQGGVKPGNRKQARTVKKKRNLILPLLLVVVGCVVLLFAAWSAVNSPVLASILSISSAPQQEQSAPAQSFAQVNIAKPTYTPAGFQPVAQEILPTATFTALPPIASPLGTATLTLEPQVALVPPTDIPTSELFTPPNPTEPQSVESIPTSDGVIHAEIVADTPTPVYVAPTAAPNVPAQVAGTGGKRWIDVDLSQQRLYAYEGDTLIRSFVVSTGTWQTPTVTGKYSIWIKLRSAPMSGPGYYLPDVPYIMYFYKGYGIHGTYWHNNFGTPMSHGCVNMTIADAEWVYNFTSVGTVVNVHY
jgi:lipoprotein-anchoring transpeptidase ErfK/SrfK